MWWVEAMSDSPPERALLMQRRPTRSAPSVWKYCLCCVAVLVWCFLRRFGGWMVGLRVTCFAFVR
jgi:hypothetical protein